jgi:hypothetical protein
MPFPLAPDTSIRNLLDRNPVIGEPRSQSRRFWTTREERLLREHYRQGGIAACLSHLPGRTASAIYNHASTLELAAPTAAKIDFRRQRWTSSDQIDAAIRRVHQRTPTKGDINRLAIAVGRPRWWVTKRASKLGLVTPRFKELAWTDDEREIVHDNYHRAPASIQRMLRRAGYTRTETAITVMGKRLGAMREDPHHVTAHGLSTLMGVDAKSVTGWIARGLLKAGRRGTDRTAGQGGDQYWIHLRDVRAFITNNASVVDIRKVDKFWLIDLLANSHS